MGVDQEHGSSSLRERIDGARLGCCVVHRGAWCYIRCARKTRYSSRLRWVWDGAGHNRFQNLGEGRGG